MIEEKINELKTAEKLFSVRQIAVATFIGMPIAGCLLLAQNYRNLNNVSSAWKTLILGFISTIVLFVIAFLLPENFPNMVLPIAYTIAMQQLVNYLQGSIIADQKGSWAVTIGVAIACLVLVMAVVFAVVFGAITLFFPE